MPFSAATLLKDEECVCGKDPQKGWHFIDCNKHGHGKPAHKEMQLILYDFVKRHTAMQAKLEPFVQDKVSVSKEELRADLALTVHSKNGRKTTMIDITSTNPLSESNRKLVRPMIAKSDKKHGGLPRGKSFEAIIQTLYAADSREKQKETKYKRACLANDFSFLPVVIEVTGGWGESTKELLSLLREHSRYPSKVRTNFAVAEFIRDLSVGQRKMYIGQILKAATSTIYPEKKGGFDSLGAKYCERSRGPPRY
jgi:hypothetical protein